MFEIKTHTPIVEHALSSLGYDFTRFAVNDFLKHVADRRQRPIIVRDTTLPVAWFGMWIQQATTDFVFIQTGLHPVQHIHSVLHEVAHMVLRHRGDDLSTLLDPELLALLGMNGGKGHLRAAGRSRTLEDQEAELFVYRLQYRVMRANRLKELYGAPTSIEELKPYTRGMDFNRWNGKDDESGNRP